LPERFPFFWLTALISLWVSIRPQVKNYWLPGLFLILFLPQISKITSFRQGDFFQETQFIQHQPIDQKTLILTDSILCSKALVHLGFKPHPGVELRQWHQFNPDSTNQYDSIWILYNPQRESVMENYFHRPAPDFIKQELLTSVNTLQILQLQF
ncbi:MAG: hypothetical protein KDC69_10470, partial [Flavobacteriaceae bacterium]|nr:hypothetical protein [Flavobacteriaceae bacterium]